MSALAKIGMADCLFEHQYWRLSPAVAGVLVGAARNCAVTAVYTWRKPRSA